MPMDISKGFQIEQPHVFVPWEASEADIERLFVGHSLRHVTTGYLTTQCASLGGLSHDLGFHFSPRRGGLLRPRSGGLLIELEFFRSSYTDLAASYKEFQRHLEATFGEPALTSNGSEGFSSHEWRLCGATIVHFVMDRFGPEEHVRIKKSAI